jgi:hypothetical protein
MRSKIAVRTGWKKTRTGVVISTVSEKDRLVGTRSVDIRVGNTNVGNVFRIRVVTNTVFLITTDSRKKK